MTKSQHIYLTGYRGTGKTSVGRILSETLGRPLVDLDDAVELAAGKSIREIFADDGESVFRDWETECLTRVARGEDSNVVSLGGGAILRSTNRDLIGGSGVCVWLWADAETLAKRIDADATTSVRRPALTDLTQLDEIRRLLEVREPLYREVADHHVETAGKTIEAIAAEIIEQVKQP